MSLRISVTALAIKAETSMARVVPIAGRICPRDIEATRIVEEINMTEAKGKPMRLDRVDAKVCSCQVIGSQ